MAGRRTKEELLAANYAGWLAACDKLRKKKKDGEKLTMSEKETLRTIPTSENPYQVEEVQALLPIKKRKVMKVINFDKNVKWEEKGNAFLCAVFELPYDDAECMLFCSRKDCPFNGTGYFRSHGIKF